LRPLASARYCGNGGGTGAAQHGPQRRSRYVCRPPQAAPYVGENKELTSMSIYMFVDKIKRGTDNLT